MKNSSTKQRGVVIHNVPYTLSLCICSYRSGNNVKVKKELCDELRHVYGDTYSQHTIESELQLYVHVTLLFVPMYT